MVTGILFKFPDNRQPLHTYEEINEILATIGMGVWPLDLSNEPENIKRLINKNTLTNEETELLKNHFLLPREKLIEIITHAHRKPHVQNGGALQTFVTTHNYFYPQLIVVKAGEDYSRFDKLHTNMSTDGIGVDEIAQFLCGRGYTVYQQSPQGLLTLHLDCKENSGWLFTYSGANPHIGSATHATIGSKLLVQVIGPEKWTMNY